MNKIKSIILLSVVCLTALPSMTFAQKYDANKGIAVLAREDGSGTKSAFMELIGLKGKADPSGVIVQTGTAGVMAEVKSNAHAIAYESLGFVTKDVKKLKIDGVEATSANIKSGAYKISRPLSIVYKAASVTSGANKSFFDFLQSKEAQKIISEEGYVSLYDNAKPYVKAGDVSGTINVSGSTSLQPLMEVLRDAYKKLHPGVVVNVAGGGSGTGYTNANGDISNFGMISEEFAITKADKCTHTVVAKDGIAVIVNKNNTFDNLTIAQLKNIYDKETASKYTKWSEVK